MVIGDADYFRASISDIVRVAGVGQGTYYLYFHSKHEIFCELVRWLGKELRRELKRATEGVTPRIEAEIAGFQAFFAFIERYRRAYHIVKQAETVDPTAYREYYETLALGYRDAIAAALAERDYAPYRTPEAIAYMLMGLGDFLCMRYQQWATEPIPEAVKADLTDFLCRALLPDRGGQRVGELDGSAPVRADPLAR